MEFLPLIGIVLLFWLFIIRPQSRRQKELRAMQSSLSVGDEVLLTSGIYASVSAIDDDAVRVEIADRVTIKVARAAVGTVLTKTEEPTDEVDADEVEADESGPVPDGPEEN